ncbi:MAG: 3-phosphoshikimate 1-carboxyvinyltransferase [Micrococcales bacterium]|nr:3-phosphoshikimate 1-carboxyvinyltransferase [Micrococcales bacterium]
MTPAAGRPGDPWPAPLAPGPLAAAVSLPGSKSLTARYLALAALASGSTRLRGALRSRDSDLMAQALRALGCHIADAGTTLAIDPPAGSHSPAAAPGLAAGPAQTDADLAAGPAQKNAGLASPALIDVGLAGTVMRFLPPVAALANQPIKFDGDAAARRRPIAPLLQALIELGAKVSYHDQDGCLPFTIQGPIQGGQVKLDATASSQFASALMLVAPALPGGLELQLDPPQLPSRPHLDMTIQALRDFGAKVEVTSPTAWHIDPGGLTGQDRAVEPDLSNAAPFLAAALVAGGHVTINDWPAQTTQPGQLLTSYLTQMGGTITQTAAGLTVAGDGRIRGANLDLAPAGELTPTLAALATLAERPSRLRGIGHLRGHETDRLAALASEIKRLGGQAEQLADGLEIHPAPLRPACLRSYGDHRMATFGAIIGLRLAGVEVEDITVTAKTMPTFPKLWAQMLAGDRG